MVGFYSKSNHIGSLIDLKVRLARFHIAIQKNENPNQCSEGSFHRFCSLDDYLRLRQKQYCNISFNFSSAFEILHENNPGWVLKISTEISFKCYQNIPHTRVENDLQLEQFSWISRKICKFLHVFLFLLLHSFDVKNMFPYRVETLGKFKMLTYLWSIIDY